MSAADHAAPVPLQAADHGAAERSGSASAAALEPNAIEELRVTLAAQVATKQISLRDLLQLRPGSVIEFDRAAGEPLDVLVNGRCLAQGEVAIVNDHYSIRFVEFLSAADGLDPDQG